MGLSVRCPLSALPLSGDAKAPDEEEDLRSALDTLALTEEKPSGNTRSLTGRELLLASSFQLAAGGEAGVPAWTACGRFATAGIEVDVDEVRMDGDVTTGFSGRTLRGRAGLRGWRVFERGRRGLRADGHTTSTSAQRF